MTKNEIKKIAHDHGFGIKTLLSGSVVLTDALGDESGWNPIRRLNHNQGYCKSDLFYALGY